VAAVVVAAAVAPAVAVLAVALLALVELPVVAALRLPRLAPRLRPVELVSFLMR
jgi:hypothetical protein